MAVAPKHLFLPDRRDVSGWIDAWNANHQGETLYNYIDQQISKLKLPDSMVDTSGSDSLEDETYITDMIWMDIQSYPNYVPGS